MKGPLCALPGCGAAVGSGKLMCREHWYMVPLKQRRLVNARWRALKSGPSVDGLKDYRRAVALAVEAAQRQLP